MIKVADARVAAAALTAGADKAEAAGATEFNFVDSLRALDDAARTELQSAIDAARSQA
jgi:hypothetical protein